MRWFLDNAEAIRAIVELLILLGAVISAFFMIWLRRSTPSRKEVVGQITQAVGDLAVTIKQNGDTAKSARSRAELAHQRIDSVERELAKLASKEDISRILQALERQDGDRRALSAKVDGVKDTLVRIETPLDMLMQEALKK